MTVATTAAAPATRWIAVAGNPNSGKTTLFNALTGLRQKVANYPGVTVEKREGTLRGGDGAVRLLDLPGTYSLSARAPDEQIPRDVLLGRMADTPPPDGVLIVIDASNLERNLYLASQVMSLGLPCVIACNMADRADEAGTPVDMARLSRELGVPVIRTVGHQCQGLDELRSALTSAQRDAPPARTWRLPHEIERIVADVAAALAAAGVARGRAADGAAILFLTDAATTGDGHIAHKNTEPMQYALRAAHERLAAAGCNDFGGLVVEARYNWISDIAEGVVTRRADAGRKVALSDRIDRVVTHKIWGIALFAAIMATMFLSIFSWAEPLMKLIEAGQIGLQGAVRGGLGAGPLRDLLVDGVIGGVGSVVVFFPQICILFLFIALLEDSGYMARAAFLMDKLMSKVGLHGKSFIPLLSSFACAIPGIMATRTIENRRDRFTTILVAPLMSCSARLPVYLTIIGVVFGPRRVWLKTGVIFSMYLLGTLIALGMAMLFKKTLLRGPKPTFIMELPPYHVPRPWPVLRTMWDRSKLFLARAGTQIVAICIVLWALAYFPRGSVESRIESNDSASTAAPEAPSARQLQHSYLGRLGHAFEPVVRPLGFDWKIGVGILASFAAREVFVGTMGTIYSVGVVDESSVALRDAMRAERWDSGPRVGRPVYTVATGLALMVFYVLCCQCVSTLAIVRRETNSWRWPAFMFSYMTIMAYFAAWLVHWVGESLAG